jgi:hypothetical protein
VVPTCARQVEVVLPFPDAWRQGKIRYSILP